jgi:lipoprotein-releasing system permease protein
VYKLLLCVRYLQTRYLAFICIVSVMLGVATLIVVNSVMSGFSTKLKDRLHGNLSDLVVDSERLDGLVKTDKDGYPIIDPNTGQPAPFSPEEIRAAIEASPAGDKIAALGPTIEVFAILQFQYRGQMLTKPVRVIGIDPEKRAAIGGFSEYLVRQQNSARPSFDLTDDALKRFEENRRQREPREALRLPPPERGGLPQPGGLPEPKMDIDVGIPQSKPAGIIPGYTIAHMRFRNDEGQTVEATVLHPGDDVTLTTVGGADLKPVWGTFLVADYIKTEMSEYDAGLVYVPLEQLQKIRGMQGRCTSIQIKLKDYEHDKIFVTDELRKIFVPQSGVNVDTWEGRQGPLLAAIDVERGILNLLLFMIVGVAGFSILAIFTMIVSEKYRDIGILKSLGASSRGVMSIFLGYGLLLGMVGCTLGTALGLWFTRNINWIEKKLTEVTGTAVFPRDVYYFKEIPTNVDPMSVMLVNAGALTIAVIFSLLPAYRASRLHPVNALRFE